MNGIDTVWQEVEKAGFSVSTDTRSDLLGSIYFALKGENFDGSNFVHDALKKGAVGAVTENPEVKGDRIYFVGDVLKALQEIAARYRQLFSIPVLAIGGSNGKTTTRELVYEVLSTKYKVHSSKGNLNNHIGLPLSILSMPRDTEFGIFEVGANHPGEHTELLDILMPNLVLVTNNGLDHLEGFGSPEGVRAANKEIYDWARVHGASAFVNKEFSDLVEDSTGLERTLYPAHTLTLNGGAPLTFSCEGVSYTTHLSGDYNMVNIQAALSVGESLGVPTPQACTAIAAYQPTAKRSQFVQINGIDVILDCYNANPSSMSLSLESFVRSAQHPRGVVLGDMLELGLYAAEEHKKVLEYLSEQKLDEVVLVGSFFKEAMQDKNLSYKWFPDSGAAREWFEGQNFQGFTFLLKGSRGTKVEKVLGL